MAVGPLLTRSGHLVPWSVVKRHPHPLASPSNFEVLRAGRSPGVGSDFITVLNSATVWPIAARTQQTGLPALGVLNARFADVSANNVAAREATRVHTAAWTSQFSATA
jgi:hypothetical protein